MKEIDNVRPLLDIPSWINGISDTTKDGNIAKIAWNKLVEKFPTIPYIELKSERKNRKIEVWNGSLG